MERVGSGGARWQCAKLNREEKLFLFFYIFNSFLTFFILKKKEKEINLRAQM